MPGIRLTCKCFDDSSMWAWNPLILVGIFAFVESSRSRYVVSLKKRTLSYVKLTRLSIALWVDHCTCFALFGSEIIQWKVFLKQPRMVWQGYDLINARLPQRPTTRSSFLPLTFSDCYIPGILKQSRQVNSTHEDHNHSIVDIVHLLKETPQVSFNLYFNLILEYIICINGLLIHFVCSKPFSLPEGSCATFF